MEVPVVLSVIELYRDCMMSILINSPYEACQVQTWKS